MPHLSMNCTDVVLLLMLFVDAGFSNCNATTWTALHDLTANCQFNVTHKNVTQT